MSRSRDSLFRRFVLSVVIGILPVASFAQIEVTSGGNVGIGITNPAEKLQVSGNISVTTGGYDFDVINSVEVPSWSFSTRPAGWYRIATNTGDRANATFELHENADHSTLIFIFGSSFASPSGMSLTVLSHNRWSNATFKKIRLLRKETYDPQYIEIYVDPHNNDNQPFFASLSNNFKNSGWNLNAFDAGNVPSGYSSTEYDVDTVFMAAAAGDIKSFRVNRDGNVGIGTTSPTHKLEVAGSVRATSFISDTTTYADFVFAPGYPLPALSEVEASIKKHGHLPGIPSAAEAKAQGIDLAAMQVKLLQKIEELTLHQIAQEKLLKAQQAEILTLRTQLSTIH